MSKKRERPQRSGLIEMSETQRIIEQGLQQQESLYSDGRGRPGHAGEVGKDKLGTSKATYNISIARQKLVKKMSQDERVEVPKNDIVEAAIVLLYNAWQQNPEILEALKVPSRIPAFEYRLAVPDEFGFFSDD